MKHFEGILVVNCYPQKTKNKEKNAGNGPFEKNKPAMNRSQMATMAQDRGENLQKKKLRKRFLHFFLFCSESEVYFCRRN